MNGMYCPFCRSDDVRQIDMRLGDGDPIFQCSDCHKVFLIEHYYYVNGKLLSEEQYLGSIKEEEKKMKIDILGDGVYIDVPVPIGSCGTCKYGRIQVFIGTEYVTQPRHDRCKECNIANGMEKYVPGKVQWSKITKLTEKYPIIVDEVN